MPSRYDDNPDIAIGIKLPLTNGQRGWFEQSYTTLDAAKSNLKNLLLTMKGERMMQPNFGTDLMMMIFEQDDGTLADKLRATIIDAVEYWLPYLRLDKVNVENGLAGDDNNVNRFNISLTFSLLNDPKRLDCLTFTLDTTNI